MPHDTRSRSTAHLALVRLTKGDNPFPLSLDGETIIDRPQLMAYIRQSEQSVATCLAYLTHVNADELIEELQA